MMASAKGESPRLVVSGMSFLPWKKETCFSHLAIWHWHVIEYKFYWMALFKHYIYKETSQNWRWLLDKKEWPYSIYVPMCHVCINTLHFSVTFTSLQTSLKSSRFPVHAAMCSRVQPSEKIYFATILSTRNALCSRLLSLNTHLNLATPGAHPTEWCTSFLLHCSSRSQQTVLGTLAGTLIEDCKQGMDSIM